MTNTDTKLIENETEMDIFDTAIKLESLDFEKIKQDMILRLKKMYAKRIFKYNKSKEKAESYLERKKILNEFDWIKKTAEKIKTAERKNMLEVLENYDLEEIKNKGQEEFIKLNYFRIYGI